MKNQLVKLAFVVSFLSCSLAYAQENQGDSDSKRAERFQQHKAEILSSLNEEKSVIEQAISCVTSAQKGDDAKKCHEAKRASMEKIMEKNKQAREANKQERKQRLQTELSKIDQEGKDSK